MTTWLDDLHSSNSPNVQVGSLVPDLLANFAINWFTLSPVLVVLFGILFGFWLLRRFKEEFDEKEKIAAKISSRLRKRG